MFIIDKSFQIEGVTIYKDDVSYVERMHSTGPVSDSTLKAANTFTVEANNAKILLDKNSYQPGEEMIITLEGITPVIPATHTIYIYKQGAPYNELDCIWGSDVPTNNPFSAKAPIETGVYEVRLHSVRYGPAESNLVTTNTFTVEADINILLDKNSYQPGEKMIITLEGATHTIHIYKQGALYNEPYNEPYHIWGSDVPINNSFSVEAPAEPGTYVVGLHSVRYGVAYSNLVNTKTFTVETNNEKILLGKNSYQPGEKMIITS